MWHRRSTRVRFRKVWSLALLLIVCDASAQTGVADRIAAADRALEVYALGRYGDAEPLLLSVTELNPWNGRAWAALGHSLLSNGKPDQAIESLEHALSVGVDPASVSYNLACAYARLNDVDRAIGWLEGALNAKFNDWNALATDPDLDPIRGDARFIEILGDPAAGLSRDERWTHDIDFCARRIERLHYDVYANVSRDEFHGVLAALKADVGSLGDDQIVLRLQRVIALIHDGHTRVRRVESEGGATYPLGFYWYSDGVHVRTTSPEHADLLGAELTSIAGRPVDEVIALLTPYVSRDNEMGVRRIVPTYLSLPVAMKEVGLSGSDGSVEFGLRNVGGEGVSVRISPVVESSPPRRVPANRGAAAPLPRYLSRARETFGFEFIPDTGLVYAWINEISDTESETFAQFVSRMFAFIDENDAVALAIDLRINGGGNNFLNDSLVDAVANHDTINRRGGIFVITGRATFSAAMDLVTDLTVETNAMIVGEPGGSGPNAVGDPRTIVLPCSGVEVRCSTLFWQRTNGWDRRTLIWPDIPAELSSTDFAANRDPALDSILEYLSGSRVGAPAIRE